MSFYLRVRRTLYPTIMVAYQSENSRKKISMRNRAMKGCGNECKVGHLNMIFSMIRRQAFRVAWEKHINSKNSGYGTRRTSTNYWWWGKGTTL